MSYVHMGQAGNRISCWCGAEYELSNDGHAVCEKDDARCRFCRFVLTLWPMPYSLKLTKWPRYRKEADEFTDLAKNASTQFLRDYYRRLTERYLLYAENKVKLANIEDLSATGRSRDNVQKQDQEGS